MRLILAVVLLLVPACLSAQEKEGKKGPPPTPKNLKVLTGESGEQVIMTMRAFRTALGVQCVYCHVQGDFASDEKHMKHTARMMIVMAQEINAKFPDGKVHVTCYTCHRGDEEPKTAPPPASAPGQ